MTNVAWFYQWEAQTPDRPYLCQPNGGQWTTYSWGEVGNQARRLAAALRAMNLPPQSNVALVAKNAAHWIIADLGIGMSGHVSVPLYPTLNGEQLNQVLNHSGCQVLLVGKVEDWAGMRNGVPTGVTCLALPNSPATEIVQWDSLMEKHEPIVDSPLPGPDDLSTIIYTSGTTGNPKGVMITQYANAFSIHRAKDRLLLHEPNRRFFSYLPLCHVAERGIVEAASLLSGGTVYFAESLETFAKNLADAQPTHFLAVPRIWTKFQLGILAKMPQAKLNRLLRIPLVAGLVKKKIRQALGLNKAQLILTGAAPMPVSLLEWYQKLGIHIREAYGMTENLGMCTLMPDKAVKMGTVGQLYDGAEIRIDPANSEVLMRAGWNMKGYYREPALTENTLREDWLHTGDMGELDADNYLTITGRVKDMFKSAKGEYVVPAPIEFGFAANSHVEQVCVVGEGLPQPIALVVLSEMGRIVPVQAASGSLEQTLREVNTRLRDYERLKKIIVVSEGWSITNGLMTPTLKIKRNEIEKKYQPQYETWYAGQPTVVWHAE